MDQAIRDEWIDALRSGEYQQTTGVLHNPATGGYCCLGVLCEIAVKHGVIPAGTGDEHRGYRYGPDNDQRQASLPYAVIEWVGDGIDSSGHIANDTISLAEENDAGRSFKFIADTIRRYL